MKALHIIVFVLLAICTRSLALTQEQEEFYRLYPDLRAHNDIVQTAFDQLKQSGFQAKTVPEANKAIALRAYELLNQDSGASSSGEQGQHPKIPYWLVLEQYNQARSQEPDLRNLSLPEFANLMNKISGTRAWDKGLNANWLERAGANIGVTFHQGWSIVILAALAGLILLVIVFRATSRSPKSPAQQHQSPVVGESVWQRAMRPAGTAAKWVSIAGALSVFRLQHLSWGERIGITLILSVGLALVIAVPVYLIAVLSYAMGASRKPAGPSIDIRFNCPRCGQPLCVEERGAGMAVNCPSCNEQIEIPRRNDSLTAPRPTIPS